MRSESSVKVTNHGMISIPAALRKKFDIKDGDRVSVFEDENGIRIIPILSIEEIRKMTVSAEEMVKIMEKNRQEELELER